MLVPLRLNGQKKLFYKKNITEKKRSITIFESDKPSPSPKRSRYAIRIVCGVCKAKVPNADWNEHVSSEHDFIAWKEGEKHFVSLLCTYKSYIYFVNVGTVIMVVLNYIVRLTSK